MSNPWRWTSCALIITALTAGTCFWFYCRAPVPQHLDSPPNAVKRAYKHGRSALLVGCAEYSSPAIRSLAGPTNDVQLMAEVLAKSCGFAEADITMLTGGAQADHAPTRDNIAREFVKLRDQVQPDDQVVILLAGHGSQQPNQPDDVDDAEPDGLDEIFLPIDAGQWSGGTSATVSNAIVDDEIHRWTAAIAAKGAWVWVMFDCCCAGTAIRGDYQEVTRFLSPDGDLGIPDELLPEDDPIHARQARRLPAWEAASDDRVVALYACQSHEAEPELPMPPGRQSGDEPPLKHGLLTYAVANVLSQAHNEDLTYHDLGREVWLRYRTWGRASPTPSVEGAHLDRRVLGVDQGKPTYRVKSRSGANWIIDGGQLHGLTPGSILAVDATGSMDAAAQHPACYAEVRSVEPLRAKIVPCAYNDQPAADELAIGDRCEVVFADFGDLRPLVAIDHERVPSDYKQLAELEQALQALAAAPTAIIRIADNLAAAEWVVQQRRGEWQLLPKSAAGFDDAATLPIGTPALKLDALDLTGSLDARLNRVFRAQNLIRLAGDLSRASSRQRDPLKLSLELLSAPGEDDADAAEGEPIPEEASLQPDQCVLWKVTNKGASAIDVTLLFLDSQLCIEAAFPGPRDLNRLRPGESRTVPATVTADTVGIEQMVVIAARASSPPRNFRWLAEPTLDEARSAVPVTRGGDDDFESPLGRFLRHAVFNDISTSTTRGLSSAHADDCCLTMRSWTVESD